MPDETVVLQEGLPLTLLAVLARHPDGLPRDDLAVLFWPGRDRELSLQSLRQTLTRLRRAIGPDRLVRDGSRIRLNLDGVEIDVAEFEAALESGALGRASQLWQGGFLRDLRGLEGWELEDWLERERSRLRGSLRGALLALAPERIAAGESVATVDGGDAGGAEDAALAELEGCARLFPEDEDILTLRFEVALARRRVADASALLEELRPLLSGRSQARLEAELEGAVERERDLAASTPRPRSSGGGESGSGVQAPVAWPLRLALLVFILLGSVWILRPPAISEARLKGHFLVHCSSIGTFRTLEEIPHPTRMDLDGRNKERISEMPGCSSIWLDSLGVVVYLPGVGTVNGLFRLDPPENPRAEWEATPLGGLPPGVKLLHAEHHGSYPQVDGRFAILTGADLNGDTLLYLLDPIADSIRLLNTGAPYNFHPVWDAEFRQVVYSGKRGGDQSLWALDPFDLEAEPVRLTDSPSADKRPAASKGRILYVRGFGTGPTEGDYEIRMLDRTTGVESVLVSRPWNDYMARWSPDGRHFCWVSEELGHFESDIWVMEVSTRKMRNLTETLSGRNYECQWGPDSQTVFFSSMNTGRAQIHRVSRSGRGVENISRSAAQGELLIIVPEASYFGRNGAARD
jgi:hypothetical protein